MLRHLELDSQSVRNPVVDWSIVAAALPDLQTLVFKGKSFEFLSSLPNLRALYVDAYRHYFDLRFTNVKSSPLNNLLKLVSELPHLKRFQMSWMWTSKALQCMLA